MQESITATRSLVGNPYLFTGRELDSETGLYNYRLRYYDPATGRFISQDPSGYADGANLYAYVMNSPLNFMDPFGLEAKGGSGAGDRPIFHLSADGKTLYKNGKAIYHSRYGLDSPSDLVNANRDLAITEAAIAVAVPGSNVVDLDHMATASETMNKTMWGSNIVAEASQGLSMSMGNEVNDFGRTEAGAIAGEVMGHAYNVASIATGVAGIKQAALQAKNAAPALLSMVQGGQVALAPDGVAMGELVLAAKATAYTANAGRAGYASYQMSNSGGSEAAQSGGNSNCAGTGSGGKKSTAIGQQGEQSAGLSPGRPRPRIPSVTRPGRYRIPDELTEVTLREIKNVANLSNTSQLRDFLAHAQSTGRTFVLETRASTKISGPLQALIERGWIVHKVIGK